MRSKTQSRRKILYVFAVIRSESKERIRLITQFDENRANYLFQNFAFEALNRT